MQDERQINHHGKVRTVKGADEGISEPDNTSTPVENISQQINNFHASEDFDRDLVNIDERIQDKALKEYYSRIVMSSEYKQKILSGCIMFFRKVKPVIAALYVICYWSAGLKNNYRIE